MKIKATGKKRITTIVVSTIIVFAIIFSSFYGTKVFATNKYRNAAVTDNIEYIYRLDDATIASINNENDENEKEIIDAIANGTPMDLPENYQKIVLETNKKIVDYFKQEIGLDVSERLSNLQVKSFDFSKAGIETFYLYFDNYSWNSVIYLNSIIIDKDVSVDMRQDYIHEVVHYLGCCQKGNGSLGCFYEGLTEQITENLCNQEGIPYEDSTAYGFYKNPAKKIMKANPELLKEIIKGCGNYDLEGKLNQTFGGKQFASQLNNALTDKKEFEVTYLINEYIKANTMEGELDLNNEFVFKWIFLQK